MKKSIFHKGLLALILALVLSVSDSAAILPVMPQLETVSAITLNKTTVSIKVGSTKKLKAGNKQGKVKWTSKKKAIATVDQKGNVTAVAPGEATIIAKDKKTGETTTCIVKCYSLKSPAAVKKALEKQKNGKYPEGKAWTNANPKNGYFWQCTGNTYGFGCYGFAAMMSDAVFGKEAALVTHNSFDRIQAGDHIRIGPGSGYHSVIVVERNGNELIVGEGNYNSSIHWGRVITKAELTMDGFTVLSRG